MDASQRNTSDPGNLHSTSKVTTIPSIKALQSLPLDLLFDTASNTTIRVRFTEIPSSSLVATPNTLTAPQKEDPPLSQSNSHRDPDRDLDRNHDRDPDREPDRKQNGDLKLSENGKSRKESLGMEYSIDDTVLLSDNKRGVISYIGSLHDDGTTWYGIKLLAPNQGYQLRDFC